ncbi:MAG TPA: SDR family NAD(P)-dependent oxidoreductase [Kofleriaceae bacterium]|jgi:NAD(P)-dependent dehydrogenase (short-subunit alcohol dehydrogenase family)|nr:SDR family NAD(P)-dependent oxidoreductase [Kofleriaceae bacterium]
MSGLVDGQLALVTGGSRGLGRAICEALARDGADVAFCYASADADAAATVEAIKQLGRRAWAFKASVTDSAAIKQMVATLTAEAGPVRILVNNAGFSQVVPVALMEEEDWDRMLDTHVKGAFIVTKAVLRGMVKEKRGRILNIGSLAGIKMMRAPVHYCTAKAALRGFTESLAKEVGRYGIAVNCLAPGILEEGVSDHLPQAQRDEYLRHCALGRVGTLREAAEAAVLLVSERNSYMSGTTVLLDGAV